MTLTKSNTRRVTALGRNWLACGASALALTMGASAAHAQEEVSADTVQSADDAGDRIVVTGSRIRTDGTNSPVPVTVVAASELEAMSPGTLITGVSQLPQFQGNQTPNSGDFFQRSGYGSLNLRGLGVNRTLTLLNGRRVPSVSAFGGVDINLFPEAVIQSVETTTGGASAAYGSDAVAGVVNFTIDTNFTGLAVALQGGITHRGDNENVEASATYGTQFAGGRGHLLVSGEYSSQAGIFNFDDRNWHESYGTFGAGTQDNPFRFVPNTVSANTSFDGRIFAPGTSLNGLEFLPDGSTRVFQPGSESQAGFGVPPSRTAGGPNEDLGAQVRTLYPDLDRFSAFAYGEYELTDNLTLFGQYMFGTTHVFQYNAPRGGFGGTPTTLTIFADNAFLPDELAQTMADEGIESFVLRRMGSLEDIGANSTFEDTSTQHIAVTGFNLDLDTGGFMDGWGIDGFYQYGRSRRVWKQDGVRVDRIFAAVDAVENGNGDIVCRTSLFGDAFPGCEPLNLFGRGNASADAINYVTGFEPGQTITTPVYFADDGFASGREQTYTTSQEKVNITTFQQHFAELAATGDIIDLWAGTVAAAFGGSYRRDSILQLVQDPSNPSANHDFGHPVLCSGEAPGLRGVSVPDCGNTVGLQYSKVSNIKGASRVIEGFGELQVPLYDSDWFTANANGAVRWADYSGSGSVWAYKGGLELGLGDSLRFRGTYSRDVRAANLSERFDKTGGVATIDDPRTPDVIEVINVTRFSGGNPAVNPEKADTWTVGAVLQPDFLPGLSLSVDYYNIQINDAISQVGTQNVVNNCLISNIQQFCDLVTLGDDGIPTLVGDVFVNVAAENVEGLDFEGSYITDVNLFGGSESLSTRFFASWLFTRSETNLDTSGNPITVDYAGQTGAGQASGVYEPYTDFRANGSVTYRNDGFSLMLQARHIGQGVQDVLLTEGVNIVDNSVSARTYLDLRLGYQFDMGSSEVEVFANVTNLNDEDPPLTPSYSAFTGYSTQHNTAVYDVLGRRYTVGVKMRM